MSSCRRRTMKFSMLEHFVEILPILNSYFSARVYSFFTSNTSLESPELALQDGWKKIFFCGHCAQKNPQMTKNFTLFCVFRKVVANKRNFPSLIYMPDVRNSKKNFSQFSIIEVYLSDEYFLNHF